MDEEKIIAEVIVKPFMKCERMVTFHFYDENACKVLATFARGSSVKNRKTERIAVRGDFATSRTISLMRNALHV
jgi:hypothetical protein